MARSVNEPSYKRIGMLGGTFDPIHLGHIKLATESIEKLSLDQLVFIPAYLPPHKPDRKITPAEVRYRMVELAVEAMDRIAVSRIELRLKGKSYSINTIKRLKAKYGEAASIFLITGADSIGELDTWKDLDELKRISSFVIATRPGYSARQTPPGTNFIEIESPDISSTEIRRRIRDKEDFKEFLPQKVYNYIIERGLYQRT